MLVILSDDVGWGEYGFQGGKDIPTPNIDSIARNGVRFPQGYVSGPYCSPTRAGLMTGRYQTRFGHEFNSVPVTLGLPLTETTFADRFHALGYATCAIGKWHLGMKPEYRPMRRGYDEFFGTLANTPYYHPTHFVDSRVSPDVQPVTDNDFYTTDAYAERAVDWLEKHKDGPWFLYLPFNAQHAPLQAPQKYLDRFPNIPDGKRRTFAAMMSAHGRCGRPRPGQGPRAGPGGEDADRLHLRQRRPDPVDDLEQRPAPRLQGDDLGRGRPRTVLHAVEGDASGGADVRAPDHPARRPADRAGRGGSGGRPVVEARRREPAPLPDRREVGTRRTRRSTGGSASSGRSGTATGSSSSPARGSGQPELYNLAEDIGEQSNLAASKPEKVRELQAL